LCWDKNIKAAAKFRELVSGKNKRLPPSLGSLKKTNKSHANWLVARPAFFLREPFCAGRFASAIT
jgi:hypothetical protein